MPVARDWMTPMPTTVTEDTPVSRVAVLLSRHAFRHLPVVDSDGVLVGLALDYSVFSRGTLVWGGRQGCDLWLAYNPDEADDPVRQVMQPVQGVVAEDAPLENVLRRLSAIGQDMVVVVDANQRPVGVISEHDPMRYASEIIPGVRLAVRDGTSPVHTTTLEEPVMDALRRMVVAGVRHFPVVGDDRVVLAVVSYRDLVAAAAGESEHRTVEHAVAHMSARVLPDDTTTAGAARVMAQHRFGCIPIVDHAGRATHILSRTDVIRVAADVLEDAGLFPSE